MALEVLRIKSQKEDQTSGQTYGFNINLGTVRSFVVSKAITLGGERKIKRAAYLALTFGEVYFEITYKGDG